MYPDKSDDPKRKILQDAGELISELEVANEMQTKISLRNVYYVSLLVCLIFFGFIAQMYFRGNVVTPINPMAASLTTLTLLFGLFYLSRRGSLSQKGKLFLAVLTLVMYLIGIGINKSLPVNLLPVVIAFISIFSTPGVALILSAIAIIISGVVLYDPIHGVNFAIAARIIMANFILTVIFQLYSRNHQRLVAATLSMTQSLKKITESLSDDLVATTLERDSARELDSETGLLNKTAFRKKIRNLLPLKPANEPLVFFRIEILQVSESLRGLSERDYLEILRKISKKISDFAGQGAVARPSKWEFVVCQEMGISEEDFKEKLNALINELKQILRTTGSSIPHKFRTGVAVWPADGASLEEVLSATEIALISAHQGAVSQPIWYQPPMRLQINELRQLADKIRSSIDSGEFYFDYQPVVDKDLKSVEFYECLVRWRHPVLGVLNPGKFIHLAIEYGHIIPLTMWSLRNAISLLKAINMPGKKPTCLSVNIAPSFIAWILKNQKRSAEFFDTLDVENGAIILEITEESFLESSEDVVNLLEDLKSRGFLIALDDFGAGYSSLSKVATLPLDYLKMDMSLVSGIDTLEKKQKTYEAMIKLGHQLGIRVVSEGVETPAELATVRTMAVDFVQGFVISKPHSSSEIGSFDLTKNMAVGHSLKNGH